MISMTRGTGGKRSRDQGGCHTRSSDHLGVRPARLIRRSDEQTDQLHGALRVLYRDYLAAGALDSLRASRCHPRPRKPSKPRRPQ